MSDQRYLVSARKYRPQIFGELVAQEHVSETLMNAIRMDRLAHAYLFSGPRGVGKTTAARILAKAVNCTTPPEKREGRAEPCRTCESCKTFEEGRSLNIIEIDAASNRGIDDIRDLRETVRVPPQGGLKKVYIVDEVHMLTPQAFNALLKTLEEPPPHILLIFATTEPHKVIPTVLSRCQRFDFRRISVPEIVSRLREICDEEDVVADDASLMLIARKGDGALRDALSVFDQAVSICGSKLVYSDLAEALRVVDEDLYFEVTNNVVRQDSGGMLRLVERTVRSGHDLQEFVTGLSEHLRNLLVAHAMQDTSLIEAAEATRHRYAATASRFTEIDLLRLLTLASDAEDGVKGSTHPRLKLETVLLKMATVALAADLRDVIRKIERLEEMADEGKLTTSVDPPHQSSGSGASAETPRAARPAQSSGSGASAETPRAAQPAGSSRQASENVLGTPALKRNAPAKPREPDETSAPDVAAASARAPDCGPVATSWEPFLDHVKNDKIQIWSLLHHTRPVDYHDETVLIAVPNDFHRRVLAAQESYILEQLRPLVDAPVRSIQFIVREEMDAPDAEETAAEFDPYEYMQRKRQENPVIRAIFDQFGGELVW